MDHGQFGIIDYAVLALYFGGMAALGPIFASRARTTEGYFLGDRSFPGWLVGFSMFATSISSITFVAFPADGYKAAWYRLLPSFTLPIAVGFAAIYFLPFFRRTKITSAYEYLEGRFGPKTRLYAASAFIIAQVFRVSTILYLVSVLVYRILQIPDAYGGAYTCIVIGGVITVFYTTMGGIRAVMWTDFTQAMVLWIGGLICLFVIVHDLPGGMGQIYTEAMNAHKFSFTMDYSTEANGLAPVKGFSLDFTDKTLLLLLLVGLGNWMAEYSSNQNVIQRYAASKNARQARIAMWVCTAFSVPTWVMFYFVGTALWVFYHNFPTDEATAMLTGAGGAKAEEILPYFIITKLPPGVTGLVIAAVLSAAMSSLSSSINGVSAVGIVDIYKRHIAKDKTDRHYVIVAKSICVVLGAIMIVGAALLYKLHTTTLQDIGTVLAALTAGGLWGLYMLGFFTKRGIDGPILVGIGCTLLFTLWMTFSSKDGWLPPNLQSSIHPYYAGIIGHVLMFVSGYAFAWIARWAFGPRFQKTDEELHNLTVWTEDDTPLD